MALVLDGSAGISGVDGTASNPAIEGTDSNTGIFYPAADTVAIGTGGTEALRVTSAQAVGVGTTSPQKKLVVSNSGAAGVELDPFTRSATTGASLLAYNRSGAAFVRMDYDASQHLFFLSGSQAMTLDTSGNLGLGVTPSAWWSSTKTIQVGAGGVISGRTDTAARNYFASNAYLNSTPAWTYIATNYATRYEQNDGQHQWYTAPSGTAGNAITFTQAMTLDANGSLLLGSTSSFGSVWKIQTYNALTNDNRMQFTHTGTGNTSSDGLLVGLIQNIGYLFNYENDSLIFGTNATERARITSGGYFKAQGNSTYAAPTTDYHEFITAKNDNQIATFLSNATNGLQYGVYFNTANDQNDATRWFWSCLGGATTRATLRSNGGLANYSANNVNLASDQRLKKDISLLDTSWDKVKQIEVVNFRYKDCNEGDPLLYGVIAQQVQPIVPELVVVTQEAKEATEDTEATPEYYGIREQPMYWLAIKALQEAMTRIEQLEAKVAALENA